ncbi:MAG: DUF3309 family protein [Hyphomicrobiales bacterium]
MSLTTILIILLILILIGALPVGRRYGYGGPGILGVIVVVLLILALMGRI